MGKKIEIHAVRWNSDDNGESKQVGTYRRIIDSDDIAEIREFLGDEGLKDSFGRSLVIFRSRCAQKKVVCSDNYEILRDKWLTSPERPPEK